MFPRRVSRQTSAPEGSAALGGLLSRFWHSLGIRRSIGVAVGVVALNHYLIVSIFPFEDNMNSDKELFSGHVQGFTAPGAVVAFVGSRNDALLCAVSFCQALVEGRLRGNPGRAIAVTNAMFVRAGKDGCEQVSAPRGVIVAPTVAEAFHDAVEILRGAAEEGRLTVVLLDAPEGVRGMEISGGLVEAFRSAGAVLWLAVPEASEGAVTHTIRVLGVGEWSRAGGRRAARGTGLVARIREGTGGEEHTLAVPEASWA